MLYCYLKVAPSPMVKKAGYFRFFSFGLIFLGTVILANASLPILLYQLKSTRFRQEIVAPVSSYYVDYSKPSEWFSSVPKLPPIVSKITHYKISVPKLKIIDATVEIDGDNLNNSLIQFPGTALPGQYGNTVIFGHSVLPQFYNPKNYKTIFSTLPTLNKGDEILVDFDGISYRYQVINMVEASPQDISVLEQRYDDRYLSLVTCVPPGTYLRRLIVRAKLVNFNK